MNIYAYTLPYSLEHIGQIKVGETKFDNAHKRTNSQLKTSNITYKLVKVWRNVDFSDKQIHKVLRRNFKGSGVKHNNKNSYSEWTRCSLEQIESAIAHLKAGKSVFQPLDIKRTKSFPMRDEQKAAVEKTFYHFVHENGNKFLWNAKMRFGKTFASYQLMKKLGAKKTIVITYVSSVMDSWREDLLSHIDFEGWKFFTKDSGIDPNTDKFVYFLSFQDLLQFKDGSLKDRNEILIQIDWDLMIIDEYHFGAWRQKATTITSEMDQILDENDVFSGKITQTIKANKTLYLSGTPLRALSNGQFGEDQIFTWSYLD